MLVLVSLFLANDSSVNGGVSAIGSVSGTTVTMGSTVQFGDNANDVEHLSIVYDENEVKSYVVGSKKYHQIQVTLLLVQLVGQRFRM